MRDHYWGEAVKRCRKKRGLTIRQASQCAGLSPVYWYLIERGILALRLKAFAKISYAFDKSAADLAREMDEIMPPRMDEKGNWLS